MLYLKYFILVFSVLTVILGFLALLKKISVSLSLSTLIVLLGLLLLYYVKNKK